MGERAGYAGALLLLLLLLFLLLLLGRGRRMEDMRSRGLGLSVVMNEFGKLVVVWSSGLFSRLQKPHVAVGIAIILIAMSPQYNCMLMRPQIG